MRPTPSVLIAVLAGAAAAQPRDATARCRAACERSIVDRRAQAATCGACLLHPGDPAAWLERLTVAPQGARHDVEWAVRWGALRLEARGTSLSPQRRLGRWITQEAGAERELACLTALHVAGASNQSLADFLAAAGPGRRAAIACEAMEERLIEATEPALFAVDVGERREAARHLSKALRRSPTQVLLRAMKTRPVAFDELVADELMALSRLDEAPAGRALLAAANPADQREVNRLLAVFALKRDLLRPRLNHGAPAERREAARQLAALAPLSAPELATCLVDSNGSVRLAAAEGLARGEGRTLAEAARVRLSGEAPATLEQQLAWLELLGDTSAPGCASTALGAWELPSAPAPLREVALSVAASCDWPMAHASVASAAASADPIEQAAAAWAAARGPTNEATLAITTRALASDDPVRLAAGLAGAGRHRQKAHGSRAAALTAHPQAAVRAEALKALAALDVGVGRLKAIAALQQDPSAQVRQAAAEALALAGGPQAMGALERAARNDPDPRVKFVAGDSLRRLGAGSLSP